MRTQRQHYIDSNLQAAREAGCDVVQLKFDGWFSRTEIVKGKATVFSRTNRELPNFSFTTFPDITCTIVGELMHGTNWAQDPKILGKTFAFDCWSVNETLLDQMHYKDRFALMKAILKRLPGTFIPVANFPIHEQADIWKRFVTNGDYEGVVYRHSKGMIDQPLYRQKDVVVGVEVAIGFEEGQGKFEGTLGAVLCESGARVGGGFDNEERNTIWNNQHLYRSKSFEVEGRKRFVDTQLLRHPNFVKWL